MSRWSTLLGLPVLEATLENNLEARAIALRAAIGTRHIVLVVDDAWEIEAALPFKVGGPNCAFLVTTRFPAVAAGIARDGVYTVPELNKDDGLELLSQLAPEVVLHDMHAAQTLVNEVISDSLLSLANVAGVRGENERAETFLQEALLLADQNNLPLIMGRVLNEWGELKLRQQQLDTAQTYFLQALDQIGQDESEQIAESQLGLARIALARGDIEEAYQRANAGLSVSQTTNQRMAHTIENWLARLVKRQQA